MDKFLIIEGRVLGGHHIPDLGIFVPYKKEVVIHHDRAMWSRDLADSIQKNQVIKKRVISGHDLPPSPQVTRVTNPKIPVQKYTSPAPVPKSLEERSEISVAHVDAVLQKSIEENSKLREMNASLMEATNQLLEQQKQLVEKLSEFMDRPPVVVGIPSLAPTKGNTPTQHEGYVEDDVPTFVPSKIRSGNAKTEGIDIKEEGITGGADKAEDALKALRSSRKGKKNAE